MDSSHNDVLDKTGHIVGYMQIIIFTILLICSGHFAFNAPSCPFATTFHDCLGVFSLMLTMFTLSFILAMAIALRQAVYMLPWLILTVIVVVSGIVYLSLYPHLLLAIFGSFILVPLTLTWYPIYRLYQRYRSESKAREEQRQPFDPAETYPLNRAAKVASPPRTAPSSPHPIEVVRVCRAAKRGDTTQDTAVMLAESNSPHSAGSPAPGWRSGLFEKMSNRE